MNGGHAFAEYTLANQQSCTALPPGRPPSPEAVALTLSGVVAAAALEVCILFLHFVPRLGFWVASRDSVRKQLEEVTVGIEPQKKKAWPCVLHNGSRHAGICWHNEDEHAVMSARMNKRHHWKAKVV